MRSVSESYEMGISVHRIPSMIGNAYLMDSIKRNALYWENNVPETRPTHKQIEWGRKIEKEEFVSQKRGMLIALFFLTKKTLLHSPLDHRFYWNVSLFFSRIGNDIYNKQFLYNCFYAVSFSIFFLFRDFFYFFLWKSQKDPKSHFSSSSFSFSWVRCRSSEKLYVILCRRRKGNHAKISFLFFPFFSISFILLDLIFIFFVIRDVGLTSIETWLRQVW